MSNPKRPVSPVEEFIKVFHEMSARYGRSELWYDYIDMGERGSKPLRIAIEACELQIPKQPISKSWSPNLCPHCDADLGGDCNDGYYQNPHYERCPVCGQKLKYI